MGSFKFEDSNTLGPTAQLYRIGSTIGWQSTQLIATSTRTSLVHTLSVRGRYLHTNRTHLPLGIEFKFGTLSFVRIEPFRYFHKLAQ